MRQGISVCMFGLLMAAGSAHAVVMSCTGGKGGGAATFGLGDSSSAACFAGNDTNQIDSSFALFGMTGWMLADKNDDVASGDGSILFSTPPTNGTRSGLWEINTDAGLSNIVITLKAGNGFGAFLLDLTVGSPLDGVWSSTKDLSHASIYYKGTIGPTPVPESGSLGLVGIGLLVSGLALVRRRRRQA